ncbi:MAG: YeiH family protein [Clostridia bacterium]
MDNLMKNIPGILFCVVLAYFSKVISSYTGVSSLTVGIIVGILYANIVGLQKPLESGTKYTLKKLLKLGIIFLGADLNFVDIYANGPRILILAILVVFTGVFLAPHIAKLFGFNDKLAMLLGVGSSVCGASAIVATAPVIEADENDTALAVAIISVLGALGVIIYPILGSIISFSDIQYGFWSGSSLQGVGHALAAAATRSELSLEMATYVKMTRVVLLAPLTLFLIRWCNKNKSEIEGKVNIKIPFYIILFIIVGIISTLGLFDFQIGTLTAQSWLKFFSKELILWAMIAMGLCVDLKKIKEVGPKALLAGMSVFVIISLTAGVAIRIIF